MKMDVVTPENICIYQVETLGRQELLTWVTFMT
jgi:hypothetical protein